MENLLMIATLIERLPHGDLKVMANLFCTSMKGYPKINWPEDEGAMLDLIYDWAVCQIEANEEDE